MMFIRKAGRTIRILACLFMARLFGEYRHSGWDGSIEYARYTWRGKDWIIPTAPVDDELSSGLGIGRKPWPEDFPND